MAGAAGFLLDKDTSVIHQSDSEGVTPLHLAIEIGLTSIIEELISLGADLNQASNDGQTPLHTAIRLCNCTKRQVEMTEALNQIQQENDDILSPSEALIQYLINEGSKNGIKDNDGHFPAQYAKDECIKQMAFKRSFGDVDTRDPPIPRSTETHRSIGNEGGILYLDSCDVTMVISPGSLEAGSCHDVSLALITEDPPTIKEDEFLTGCGVEINIPRLWLYSENQPITITLPHAASHMKANKEFVDIIWKHTESTSENQGRRGTFVKPSGTS
nr:ankyrin repeat domain-containing protein 49-like [Lytechinus pictus]